MAPTELLLLRAGVEVEVPVVDSLVVLIVLEEVEEEVDEDDVEDEREYELTPDGNCVPVEVPPAPVNVGMATGTFWPMYVHSTSICWLA
jgi:hypothetical protein